MKRYILHIIAALALLILSYLAHRLPRITPDELAIVSLLFGFFVALRGLENSGVLEVVAAKTERGNMAAAQLVAATYLLALFVTNDVALLSLVPLALRMNLATPQRVVALMAIAANAAALFPFSNPQNLFIYWRYRLDFVEFVQSIAPFSLTLFALALLFSLRCAAKVSQKPPQPTFNRSKALLWGGLFGLAVLAVVRIAPVWSAWLPVLAALFVERRALRVDYGLLALFLLLFAVGDLAGELLERFLAHPHHAFLLTVTLSQIAGNVTAAVVVSDLGAPPQAVLWGANVGGYGALWSSFATLIAYRLCAERCGDGVWREFAGLGLLALAVGAGLYFLLISF